MKIPDATGFGQVLAQPEQAQQVRPNVAASQATMQLAQTAGGIAIDSMAAETRQRLHDKKLAEDADAARRRVQMINDAADLQDTVNRGVLDGTIPKDKAGQEWAARFGDMMKGRLDGAAPDYAGMLQVEAENLQRRGLNGVNDAVYKRTQQDTHANLMGLREESQRMATRDRPRAISEYFAQIDSMGPAAGMNPAQIQAEKQAFKEQTAYTNAFAMVRGASRDLGAVKAARTALGSDQFSDLDPQHAAALHAQLDGYEVNIQQRAEIAAQRAERLRMAQLARAEATFKAAQARTDAGIPDSPDQTAATVQDLAGTPYLDSYKAIQQQAREIGGAGALPVPVLKQQIDALMAKRAQEGASEGLDNRIKALQKVSDAQQAGYRADAWGEGLQRGVITSVPPLDMRSFDTLASSLQARKQAAQVLGVAAGEPVSLLRPDEAKMVAGLFDKLTPAEKSGMVGTLYSQLGAANAMATFKQIGKDDALLTVAAGLHGQQTQRQSSFLGIHYGQTENRSVPQLIFQGADLVAKKQVKLPEDPARNAVFQEYIGNAIPNPQARQAAAEATDAIYAKLAFEAGHFDDDKVDARLYKRAANFVTGGLLEWNGGNKILPPAYGMPEGRAREVLMNITPAQVKAWGGVAGMTDEQAAEYIRTAPLESQTIGKYRVQAGGGILHNKTGGAFEMRF